MKIFYPIAYHKYFAFRNSGTKKYEVFFKHI